MNPSRRGEEGVSFIGLRRFLGHALLAAARMNPSRRGGSVVSVLVIGLRRFLGHALLAAALLACLSACSLLVRALPACGDGDLDPGELCFAGDAAATEEPLFALALADIDGDGALDAVASSPETSALLALRGDLGAFEAPSRLVGLLGPVGVAAADLDGDGDIDLAAADPGPGFVARDPARSAERVALFLNGGGELALAAFLPAPGLPANIAAGDLNGDGAPELVTANLAGLSLSVLPNLGGGQFGAPAALAFDTRPSGLALADLDLDGDLDIVAASDSAAAFPTEAPSNLVRVFANQGDGSFVRDEPPLTAGDGPRELAVADFDRDGAPDILVVNGLSGDLSLLFGRGGRQFSPEQRLAGAQAPTGLALADLDLDGDLDAATASAEGALVLFANDAGALSAIPPLALGPGAQLVAAGDLNGDEIPDLAISRARGGIDLALSAP